MDCLVTVGLTWASRSLPGPAQEELSKASHKAEGQPSCIAPALFPCLIVLCCGTAVSILSPDNQSVYIEILNWAKPTSGYFRAFTGRYFIFAMARSWTTRLAATIAASQLLPFVSAQSSTPTASGISSVTSASPSSTDSIEAKVHMIKAGAGGWKFDPQEIHNVSVGDIVKWEFYPPDHSVARAEFGSACVPYEYTGNDKVGFWSETQWVNNTNEVRSFKSTWEDAQDILTSN
jgi:plastocyanin